MESLIQSTARTGKAWLLELAFRYGGAMLAVAAATGLRELIPGFFGARLPFVTYYPTVALVAIVCGGGPGLLTTVLSVAIVSAWLLPGDDAGEIVALALFAASGVLVSAMAETLRRIRQHEAAGLEEQVAARTSELQTANARLRQEIEERRRAEETLRESEARLADEAAALARLTTASSRLWRILNLREGLDEMLAAIMELLGADRGSVEFLDANRGEIEVAAQCGFAPDFLDVFRQLSAQPDSFCSRAMRSGERIVIEDVEADKRAVELLPLARAAGFRAVQATPLRGRDDMTLGMLCTYFRAPHRPSNQELRRLDLYARQAADFIERCRISQSLRESQERWRLFIEHAPAALAMFDRDMRYLAVSRRWMMDFQLGDLDIIGRSHYEVFIEIPERWKEVHRRGLAGEVLSAAEDRFVRADGREQWLHWEVRPWYEAGGAIGGIVIFAEEITERKRAEESLRDREARLRAILDTAVDAIVTINHAGIIQSVNPATERLFGYTTTELIGQNVRILMPAPYRDEHDCYVANYLRTGDKKVLAGGREVVGRRKDGSTFPADLAVNEMPHLKLFTGIIRDITRRKQLEHEVVEIASLEQRRIGQDLHDSVGQELTALNLLAGDLVETLRTDPAAATDLVRRLAEGLRRCRSELRTAMRGLLPVPVDTLGLMAALSELADRTHRDGRARCTFTCVEPVSVDNNLTATHLYLIAQEAVHNALKHAQARNIEISLRINEVLQLGIQDDGLGIPKTEPDRGGGLGLRIMRNRAAIVGARLTIEPAQPSGTLVVCTLPRVKNAQERETSQDPDRG